MSKKSKVSVGFRTTEDKNETPIENWDVYPTHLYMPKDYWTVSTTADEVKKKTKKKKK